MSAAPGTERCQALRGLKFMCKLPCHALLASMRAAVLRALLLPGTT